MLSGGEKLYGNRRLANVRITYVTEIIRPQQTGKQIPFLLFYRMLRRNITNRHIAKAKLYAGYRNDISGLGLAFLLALSDDLLGHICRHRFVMRELQRETALPTGDAR